MISFPTWQKTVKQIIADQRAIIALSNNQQDTHAAASSAIELYKHLKHTMDIITGDIEASMNEAKAVLADILSETHTERIEAPAGVAYIPKPGTIVSYNTQSLDMLCSGDPALAEKIAPFRKVTARPGSLTIR